MAYISFQKLKHICKVLYQGKYEVVKIYEIRENNNTIYATFETKKVLEMLETGLK